MYNTFIGVIPRKLLRKLVMTKIAVGLLLILCWEARAEIHAQTVTLDHQNALLEDVLEEVREQTGYSIFYDTEYLAKAKKVSLKLENASLEATLEAVFANQLFSYRIENDVIVITPKALGESEWTLKVAAYAEVRGRIVDSLGNPLPGSSIRVINADGQRTALQAQADQNGYFSLQNVPDDATLLVSFIGYVSTVVKAAPDLGTIALRRATTSLKETVVNAGYYSLPRERATGSYTHLSTDDLEGVNSLSLKDKLEGLVPGLLFEPNYNSDQNPTTERSSGIVVRGRSTLGDNAPLIVVDGFPVISSDGVDPWATINTEDVADVTVLKDAAAASIWGAQAANGVIVITTKQGRRTQGSSLNVNLEFLSQPEPDLYEIPFASSRDALDIYKYLYLESPYFNNLNQAFFRDRYEFPEVVDVLLKMKTDQITEEEGNQRLSELAQLDVRDEFGDLFYRTETHRKVNLSFSSTSQTNSLRASVMGLQSNEPAIGDQRQQVTGNVNNRFSPTGWFAVSFGVNFSLQNDENNGVDIRDLQYIPQMSRILDADGEYLPMIKNNDDFYFDTPTARRRDLVEQHNLPYDWDWNIKRELDNLDRTDERNDLRLNGKLEFTPFKGFNADLSYQYQRNSALTSNYMSPETWYVRNAVNENYRPDAESFPVPVGGMLYERRSSFTSHNTRMQVTYDRVFTDHGVRALAGTEIRSDSRSSLPYGFYGYDPQTLTHVTALNFRDEVNPKLTGKNEFRGTIPPIPTLAPTSISIGGREDRFLSYYGNVGYTFRRRYDITGSVRLDQTNLYGRSASYRELPQWSGGLGYTISDEPFFDVKFVDHLRFRAAYGWNGHIDKSASPFIAGTPWLDPINQAQYAAMLTTPNPALTWEKTENFNLGLDFAILNRRIQGMIEIYTKRSTNVLADFEVNPTYGFYYDEATLNQGDITNDGVEIDLSSQVFNGIWKWRTAFNYSHNKNVVKNVTTRATNQSARTNLSQFNPVAGQPVDYLAVAEWAGYSDEGLPQVYYGDEILDITQIPVNGGDLDLLQKFVGQRSPKHFGSWINDVSYRSFRLSARLLYSFGHKFLNDSPPRNTLYNYQRFSNYFTWHPAIMVNRWQSPADNETASMFGLGTRVANYAHTLMNDNIAEYNTSNVLDAGQIRLQSISLAYTLPHSLIGFVKTATLQLQARNLGPIFLVNDEGVDPAFPKYSGSLYSAYYNVIRDRPEYSLSLRISL